MALDVQISTLRCSIAAAEAQLKDLRAQLARLEDLCVQDLCHGAVAEPGLSAAVSPTDATLVCDAPLPGQPGSQSTPAHKRWPLGSEEYQRYGRTMIMHEHGLQGQLRLKKARVLIVGCGGLGCPAAAYLAGAGIGTLGLMDGDVVEMSNLHRQIAHSTDRIGMRKVDSARTYLEALNPLVRYETHPMHLTSEAAVSIFEKYDLVLDCTDHPTSRYLISDACVITGKPLISASALRSEGQLIVLNNPPRPAGDDTGGPCYRCIFPKPPPADSVLSCGEGGILGPIVGTMGVLQALEAIKVLTANPTSDEVLKPTLLMFSGYSSPQFRTVRMRSRRAACDACSSQATIVADSLTSGSLDYVRFCGVSSPLEILPSVLRVSPAEYLALRGHAKSSLIDVRDENQFSMCALENSTNIPWTDDRDGWLERARQLNALPTDDEQCFIICRFGNDSQLAVQAIVDLQGPQTKVKDVKGGFNAWHKEVDQNWPQY